MERNFLKTNFHSILELILQGHCGQLPFMKRALADELVEDHSSNCTSRELNVVCGDEQIYSFVSTSNGFFVSWSANFRQRCTSLLMQDLGSHVADGHVLLGCSESHKKQLIGDSASCSGMLVAFDAKDNDRVFVGESQSSHATLYSLLGAVVYFAPNGRLSIANMLNAAVCCYDWRNGSPASMLQREPVPDARRNLYLCGRFLGYRSVNRDGYGITLAGLILTEMDGLGKHRFLLHRPDFFSKSGGIPICYGQWVLVGDAFVDLQSICTNETTLPTVDILKIGENTPSAEVMRTLKRFSVSGGNLTDRDGYPAYCVKCTKETVSGFCVYFETKSESGGWCESSLGESVCVTCGIRFSRSDGVWQCFRVPSSRIWNNYSCGTTVEAPDYVCSKVHQIDSDSSPTDPEVNIYKVSEEITKKRVGQNRYALRINAADAKERRIARLSGAPFGYWTPRLHLRAPYFVRDAIFTWLLISKMKSLPWELAFHVAAFICTKEQAWSHCWRWGPTSQFMWQVHS